MMGKKTVYRVTVSYKRIRVDALQAGDFQDAIDDEKLRSCEVWIAADSGAQALEAAEYLPFSAIEGLTSDGKIGPLPGFTDATQLIAVGNRTVEKEAGGAKLVKQWMADGFENWNIRQMIQHRKFDADDLLEGLFQHWPIEGIPPVPPVNLYGVALDAVLGEQSLHIPVVLIAADMAQRAVKAAHAIDVNKIGPLPGFTISQVQFEKAWRIEHLAAESVRAIEAMSPTTQNSEKLFSARQLLGEGQAPMPEWARRASDADRYLGILRGRFGDGPNDTSADDVIFKLSPHEVLRHVILATAGANVDPALVVDTVDALFYAGERAEKSPRRPASGDGENGTLEINGSLLSLTTTHRSHTGVGGTAFPGEPIAADDWQADIGGLPDTVELTVMVNQISFDKPITPAGGENIRILVGGAAGDHE